MSTNIKDSLASKLRIKATMITMGETIAWGSESSLMWEAAAVIELLEARVKVYENQTTLHE